LSLRPIGGIFLRLDASGNLTVYDASGNTVAKFIGGVFSSKASAAAQTTNTSISTTASTTPVYAGIGVVLTPQVSTRVLVEASGAFNNNTGGDGCEVKIIQNTGSTVHAGGGAAAGTVIGDTGAVVTGTANFTWSLICPALSLTVGTSYVFDIAVNAVTGGTMTFAVTVNCPVAEEF